MYADIANGKGKTQKHVTEKIEQVNFEIKTELKLEAQ